MPDLPITCKGNRSWKDAFSALSTPLVAGACLRIGRTLRIAPSDIRPSGAGGAIEE